MLQGRRVEAVYEGVYRTAETPESFELLDHAALRVLPHDATLRHTSNLRWRGYDVPEHPIHFSTSGRLHEALTKRGYRGPRPRFGR